MKRRSHLVLSILTSCILANIPIPVQAFIWEQGIEIIVQRPDLSKAVITTEDLPNGFKPSTPDELAKLKRDFSSGELSVQSVFGFSNNGDLAQLGLIAGATYLIPDRFAQVDSSSIQNILSQKIIAIIGDVSQRFQGLELGRQPTQALTNLDGIGDFAVGATRALEVQCIPVRMDAVTFRRGKVIAFVLVGYVDGVRPAVNIATLARQLDSRIPK